MGGGIEEGIETMSSNDTADENEVTSPGRMSKPRGVAFFGCLGLGLFAAFMGVGVIHYREIVRKEGQCVAGFDGGQPEHPRLELGQEQLWTVGHWLQRHGGMVRTRVVAREVSQDGRELL